MSRHILDKSRKPNEGQRVSRFMQIARSMTRHSAIAHLLRRSRARHGSGKFDQTLWQQRDHQI